MSDDPRQEQRANLPAGCGGKFNGPNVGVYGESAEILLSECSLMTLDDIPEDDVDALDPLIPEDVMRAERYTRENRDFWHDPPGA